jgi:hypothetical protein
LAAIGSNIAYLVRSLKILSLSATLSLIVSTAAFPQNDQNGIQFSFLKTSDSLKSTQLYFNVLKIINTSQRTIAGTLALSGPENWRIIGSVQEKLFINPGDTMKIPVRVSPSADATGGIAYVVGASLKTATMYYTTNAYVVLPSYARWDFNVQETSIYFTEFSPDAIVVVNLSNRGNTNEMIKLNFQPGKLLLAQKSNEPEFSEFINLPAFRDTSISYTFSFNKSISSSDLSRYENNWRESAVIINASTETVKRSSTVSIRKLKSEFYNLRNQSSSPLNLDLQVYNLMSNQKARFNFKTYGTVLFPKNKDVQYHFGIQNIFFDSEGNRNFDINRQLLYSARYRDNRNNILVSYNINGGDLHSIYGRGIEGELRINKTNNLYYSVVQNPFSDFVGEYLGYTTVVRGMTLNASVTNENSTTGAGSSTSVQAGTGFTFLKHHNLSLQFLGSLSNFNNFINTGRDTSVTGYSYRLFYNLKYRNLELRFNGINTLNNYTRNSGMQQLYLDGRYSFNEKTRLNLYGNRQYYSVSRYPYNFIYPVNYNSNDFLRLTASFTEGSVLYQAGPTYNGSMREFNDPVSGYLSSYKTWQPGLWGAVTFRLRGYRSITPNLTVSNMIFDFSSEDPSTTGYSINNNIYYTAGLSYYDNVWKVNAYYSNGSTTDLYRSLQVDEKPVLSRSVQVRPSYEKYFFDRRVKIGAYINYAYYMPSGRENVSYSLRFDTYLRNGWSFNINGFVYSNTRVSDEYGRVNTKDLNMIVGVVKSFELQQPRQKYYDLRAVFFNDLDGDKIKSDNEPPVANILVNIEKDRLQSATQGSIASIDLISDSRGEIFYENLPEDHYRLTLTPLVNLQSLYFIDGSEQTVYNDNRKILYIPLAESYKIKGKVIVIRDPNSSEGKVSLSGIRITAVGAKGETYSALTDRFGSYVVNVPKGDRYRVRVNNVFGEQFTIETDETEIQFGANKTLNLDFTFIEKRREIRFNNGDDYSRVTSGRGAADQ